MVTSAGNNAVETWNKVENLECSLSPSPFEGTYFNGLVDQNFNADLSSKDRRYMDKGSQMALIAANEAIKDSGLMLDSKENDHAAIFMGSSLGGIESLSQELIASATDGLDKISVLGMTKSLPNMLGANISIKHQIGGGVYTYSSACSSGAVALGEAYLKIQREEIDIAIAGGSEACATIQIMQSFKMLGAVSTSLELKTASIPFSKKRSGFVLSEGAAILILETLESALERDANIYAEIVGYGSTSDGTSLVAPDQKGIEKCMKKALKSADMKPENVEYINAHGTATQTNDEVESRAIERIFGNRPKVSSTKSILGHSLGATGAVEAALCCQMIKKGILIPTINVKKSDVADEIKLSLLLDRLQKYEGGAVISNSFAFGGHNVSLVFKEA